MPISQGCSSTSLARHVGMRNTGLDTFREQRVHRETLLSIWGVHVTSRSPGSGQGLPPPFPSVYYRRPYVMSCTVHLTAPSSLRATSTESGQQRSTLLPHHSAATPHTSVTRHSTGVTRHSAVTRHTGVTVTLPSKKLRGFKRACEAELGRSVCRGEARRGRLRLFWRKCCALAALCCPVRHTSGQRPAAGIPEPTLITDHTGIACTLMNSPAGPRAVVVGCGTSAHQVSLILRSSEW